MGGGAGEPARASEAGQDAREEAGAGTCQLLVSKAALRVVEGGGCDLYAVRLSGAPRADVVVQITALWRQVRVLPKALRFSADAREGQAGHWALEQRVRVVAVDDDAVEAMNETVAVRHETVSSDRRWSSQTGDMSPVVLPIEIVDNDGGFLLTFGEVCGKVHCALPTFRTFRAARERLAPGRRSMNEPGHAPGPDGAAARPRPSIAAATGVAAAGAAGAAAAATATAAAAAAAATATASAMTPGAASAGSMGTGASSFSRRTSSFTSAALAHTPGTLAPPTLEEGIRSVACGDSHLMVVLSDGQMVAMGEGEHGQLGLGKKELRNELSGWLGFDRDGVLRSIVTSVACGEAHSALVTDDGRVLTCGSNALGQLGVCEADSCTVCFSLRADVSKSASGNSNGKPITSGGHHHRHQGPSAPTGAPAPLPQAAEACKAYGAERAVPPSSWPSSSSSSSSSPPPSGSAAAHGCGEVAEEPVPRLVSSLAGLFVEHVACGANHTVALVSNGASGTDRGLSQCRLFGWGDSRSGALGVRGVLRHPCELDALGGADPFAVACGGGFTAVLCGAGELWTAGWGLQGCMGRRCGEEDPRLFRFARATVGDAHARRPHEQPCFVDLACGHGHLAVLSDRQAVYVCGANESGQLGVGDRVARALLTRVVFLDGLGVCGLALGMFHSCALTGGGDLLVWGSNDHGQLGLGESVLTQDQPRLCEELPIVKQVCAGKAFTAVITAGRAPPRRSPAQQRDRAQLFAERLREAAQARKDHERARLDLALSGPAHRRQHHALQRRLRVPDPQAVRSDAHALPYALAAAFEPRRQARPPTTPAGKHKLRHGPTSGGGLRHGDQRVPRLPAPLALPPRAEARPEPELPPGGLAHLSPDGLRSLLRSAMGELDALELGARDDA
jgi:alpha-tubulin suppressor-like RCC1 family protein